MNYLSYWVLLTVVCCVCCFNEDLVEEQFDESDETREGKQLRGSAEQGGWRGLDPFRSSEEWTPQDTSAPFAGDVPEKQFPRRRRIRKRKRRPPLMQNSEESQEYPLRRRRIRPQTLEDVSDSWAEIEDESPRRPYHRRRTTPVYYPEEVQTEQNVRDPQLSAVLHFEDASGETARPPVVYEKVRDPYTALEEAEAKARLKKKQLEETEQREQETTTVSYLKALLKQSGGSFSLSEILQQKNLSLDDLLKGKHHAISALTEGADVMVTEAPEVSTVPEAPRTESPSTTTEKILVTPHNHHIIKTTSRNYEISEESYETITPKENLDQDDPGVGQPIIKFTPDIHNYEVVTEPTTDHRIFIPAHPKLYTSFNYKSNAINKSAEITIKTTTKAHVQLTTKPTPSSTTRKNILGNKYLDYRSKYLSLKPKLKTTLPITSAKMNRASSKRPEVSVSTATPLEAFKIDIKDLLGIPQPTNKPAAPPKPKEDGPMKMTIAIAGLTDESTGDRPNLHVDLLKNLDDSENEVTTDDKTTETSTKYQEKISPTSAREEIMEILRDHVSRQNLSRILELRNMTIEELVAQRERGSSQLHLADIFHNQTREPEPPSEPYVGQINPMSEDFAERQPKAVEIKKDSHGSNYFTSIVDVVDPAQLQLTDDKDLQENKNPSVPTYSVTSFPTYKIEMEKIMKHNQPPPFQISIWKNLYPDLYVGDTEDTDPENDLAGLKTAKVQDVLQNEIRRVEDVENTISDAVNGQLNVDLGENNYEDDDGFVQLPRGVKSVIIVSAAIIGISVLVFLTVFFVFKWTQKQKERLRYSNSFSCSRIKSPILETLPKRTIRTIMNETLGRSNKYSNVHPQSMSDYIWESDKKPFQ